MTIGFETFDINHPDASSLLMSLASSGIWGHCEIHFSDGAVGTAGDKRRGVMLISDKDKVYKPENWQYFQIPAKAEQEAKVRKYFVDRLDEKYNWTGIFGGMIAGFNLTNSNGQFCSEICFNAMVQAGIIQSYGLKGFQLSPSHLFEIVTRLGFKKVEKV
ncbi:hypothetical protein SAMN04515674_104279 [Pseudarcicella hirudinis]|uniref:Permuted papain-like amidase enzyme, YaeF/YiiX, C92 family n=1 Tax=Pseudarcicella hirudinis TaxID=1079859 RepID=A0A1I5RWW0_9BACT|nr:hypothetical protein [Pseudarcicella hirudinis]SFP62761.1 hypothetical protein SAMN04515674_104279 [Pseudarcicella hirudinis]